MRKLSIFLLAGLLLFPLTACDGNANGIPLDDGLASEHRAAVYEIGDIILKDGTSITSEELASIDSENPPVAVAAIVGEDGTVIRLGLHISNDCLPWAVNEEQGRSPAFAFADDYAATYGVDGAWRMPDIEELSAVYENREAVDASLRRIYELDSTAAVDGLGTNWYWASTPSETEDGYAWFVHYFNGYAACCPTDFDNLHVMAVCALQESER